MLISLQVIPGSIYSSFITLSADINILTVTDVTTIDVILSETEPVKVVTETLPAMVTVEVVTASEKSSRYSPYRANSYFF
jgi:hypothetical protein